MSFPRPRVRLALTLGDPAGIGPEIVAKVCHDPEVKEAAELVVVGRPMLLAAGSVAARVHMPEVELIAAGEGRNITPGQPGPATGAQAAAFVEKAVELCQSGNVAGMVTAPISKEAIQAAGYSDTGHTSMLGRLLGVERPVMMLLGPRLKVVLATIHCALADVPQRLSIEGIVRVARVAHQALVRHWGLPNPRLAVAALNPHAGENGIFGDEEARIILPAVQALQAQGIAASGPWPPDTLFWRAAVRDEFDAVVCMYHDQGLIPFKMLAFDTGVNVTLGISM
ncbi:MAG: 4-hydroxythreonine-4-phosphate dehydrogenase PdxA, partial [Desulfovibrio sp.]|nr:4-hydroxythreonine-4-phosphate dehydrogenase PdxA [Desulfovibrio sp.]